MLFKRAFALIFLIGCGCSSVSGGRENVSASDAVAIQKTLEYLGARYQFGDDPQVSALLRRIVGRLELSNASLSHITAQVYVLKNAEPNAFSLKGGFIFVTSGLFSALRSESELAAVLAHELGHHLRGDTDREPQTGSLFLLSEEDELAADALSVTFLARARYEPSAALSSLAAFDQSRMREDIGVDRAFLQKRVLQLRCELNTLTPQFGATENSREFNHARRIVRAWQ